MPEETQALKNAWTDTDLITDSSFTERHIKSFLKYAIGFGLLAGIVNVIIVTAFGIVGALLSIPLNLFVSYKIVTRLFIEVDRLIVRRIQWREGQLTKNLSE